MACSARHLLLRRSAWALALAGVMVGGARAETLVSMWVHAGRGPERDVYIASVRAFNERSTDVKIKLLTPAEGRYNEQVNAAAKVNWLPCVLDLDGPHVSRYAWEGKIVPLDELPIAAAAKAQMLPTLLRQGTYNGKLYSVAQYDSGLALWGRRTLLQRAGLRIPKGVDDAWTLPEFEEALRKLKAQGLRSPLDMKFNYGAGEWLSYGFAPLLQSFGADLVDRKTERATGTLNSPAAVKAMSTLQAWVRQGWVDPRTSSDDDFVQGRSALSWVGHWTFDAYRKALGDDLVLIPMPRFGTAPATGAGSWNFAVSRNCNDPAAASKVLQHLLSTAEILRVTAVNGAVPATREAQAASPHYAPGGALRLYVEQSDKGVARVRPQTPAYPVISAAFAAAVHRIAMGADVKAELDAAAKKIDDDIAQQGGYPAR